MSTRTSKNNIKWWEILPSSDKEIKVLKNSFNFWLRPRKKKTVLEVSCYFHLPPSMYAAWPDNICSKSTSSPSSKAFRLAYLSVSLYLSLPIGVFRQIQVVRNSVTRSLSINITPKYYVTKKRACNVLFSEFPAPTPESKQFSVV